MHADLIKPEAEGGLACARDDDGNIFISQYMLKKLLTLQVRYMSHQKKICGCEDCIRADVLHSSLNNWRLGHIEMLHTKVSSSSGRRS